MANKEVAPSKETRRPSEVDILDRIQKKGGITDYVWTQCSITDTLLQLVEERAERKEINLYKTPHEHNHFGMTSGIWFGSGRHAVSHLQNTGITNSADGYISYANQEVYGLPSVVVATYRGSNTKDDSEPHQAIGRRTDALTKAIFGSKNGLKNVFGSRYGERILYRIDQAIAVANKGGVGVIRLSPDAFVKSKTLYLPEKGEFDIKKEEERRTANRARIESTKGNASNPIKVSKEISREEAMDAIIENHPEAAIIFSNGFTARAAQGHHDLTNNFYNAGYMGGGRAIGWGIAVSNPHIEVVVVDGDQNAQMSCMNENLANHYPDNLFVYVLDNRMGASVGPSDSLSLGWWHWDLARIIPTKRDEPDSFSYPRVGKGGMEEQLGTLHAHAERFRSFVIQQTERNKAKKLIA